MHASKSRFSLAISRGALEVNEGGRAVFLWRNFDWAGLDGQREGKRTIKLPFLGFAGLVSLQLQPLKEPALLTWVTPAIDDNTGGVSSGFLPSNASLLQPNESKFTSHPDLSATAVVDIVFTVAPTVESGEYKTQSASPSENMEGGNGSMRVTSFWASGISPVRGLATSA